MHVLTIMQSLLVPSFNYKPTCSYGNGDPSALNTSKSRTSVFCASLALLCGSTIFIQPPAGKVMPYRWYFET